jgi:hypothetical protein
VLKGKPSDGIQSKNKFEERAMTIQKKSLISTLNTTKKATVASSPASGTAVGEKKALGKNFGLRKAAGKNFATKKDFALKYGKK